MTERSPSRLPHLLVVLLSVALAGGTTLTFHEPALPQSSELSVVGADFSSLLQVESRHRTFSDGDVAAPLEDVLSRRGVNYSRIRLWVDPVPGSNDLAAALALAKRSAAAGMEIFLDLHYSDTWADKANQQVPAAWASHDHQQMLETVRSYTEEVVRAFSEQGTPVSMVQIGNEVTNGMLWSWGKIEQPWGEYWQGFAELHEAGIAGAVAADPQRPPRTVLHLHGGGDSRSVGRFLEKAEEHGMTIDIVGVTYYPFWSGPLEDFRRFLHFVADRYDKDILVVETGYPWTLAEPAQCRSVVTEAEQLPELRSYLPSPEGQAAYFRGLREVLESIPGGHGLGYVVWEPAWMPDVELADETCNAYAALTLFDWYGNALPALRALAGPET